MLNIKIFLSNDGSVAEVEKDFEIYAGEYQNKLLSFYVPKEFVVSNYFFENAGEMVVLNKNKISTYNDTFDKVDLTTLQFAREIITRSGKIEYSKSFYAHINKFVTINGVEYALFSRILPYEMTENDTSENVDNIMTINVINIKRTKNGDGSFTNAINRVMTSQKVQLEILPSNYLASQQVTDDSLAVISGEINSNSSQIEQNTQAIEQLSKDVYNSNLSAKGILPYDSTYAYHKGELVQYNNRFYVSLVDNNVGGRLTDATKWKEHITSVLSNDIFDEIINLQNQITGSFSGEYGADTTKGYNQVYINEKNDKFTSDINDLRQNVDAIKGTGGYLKPYNFGTATPTTKQLNDYALTQITNITEPTEIWDGTRVTNTFNNHTWILNNTQNTSPVVFEWVDLGQEIVSVANETTLGVVKASSDNLKVNVDSNGIMAVNGLENALANFALKSDVDKLQSQIGDIGTLLTALDTGSGV